MTQQMALALLSIAAVQHETASFAGLFCLGSQATADHDKYANRVTRVSSLLEHEAPPVATIARAEACVFFLQEEGEGN
jgi:hypothetical protein